MQPWLYQTTYRIFSINHWGHLFKTLPHGPGGYLGPGVYLLSAFIIIIIIIIIIIMIMIIIIIISTGGLLN